MIYKTDAGRVPGNNIKQYERRKKSRKRYVDAK